MPFGHYGNEQYKSGPGSADDLAPPFTTSSIDTDSGAFHMFVSAALADTPASSTNGIISFWYQLQSHTTFQTHFRIRNASGLNLMSPTHRDDNDKWRFDFTGPITTIETTGAFAPDANWHHLLFAWVGGTASLYIDDVSAGFTYVAGSAVPAIDWTVGAFHEQYFYQDETGIQDTQGCVGEMYINTQDALDITITANRRKFIDASGKPVSLGSDGSTPTGNQPTWYYNGGPGSHHLNQGGGGNNVAFGTAVACASEPTD